MSSEREQMFRRLGHELCHDALIAEGRGNLRTARELYEAAFHYFSVWGHDKEAIRLSIEKKVCIEEAANLVSSRERDPTLAFNAKIDFYLKAGEVNKAAEFAMQVKGLKGAMDVYEKAYNFDALARLAEKVGFSKEWAYRRGIDACEKVGWFEIAADYARKIGDPKLVRQVYEHGISYGVRKEHFRLAQKCAAKLGDNKKAEQFKKRAEELEAIIAAG